MSSRRKAAPPHPSGSSENRIPVVASTQENSIAPAVPAHVIFKLLGFTFAMIVGPISCYFLSLNKIFGGNSTYAGATAAITANLVLVGYVIVAFREDQGDKETVNYAEKKED